jgi:hypothetical protein
LKTSSVVTSNHIYDASNDLLSSANIQPSIYKNAPHAAIFWIMKPCGLLGGYRSLETKSCLDFKILVLTYQARRYQNPKDFITNLHRPEKLIQ